jgi:hypothetical protein
MIVSGLALAGCASSQMAEENAQDLAAEHCAKHGQAFAQTGGTAESNGAVAAATAQGQCVDPNEAPPPPPPPPPG